MSKGVCSMSDFRKYFEKQLQNEEFRAEHEATRAEFEVVRALIAARLESNLSQKELAELSGVRQSNISRIENGNCVPSLTTLQALAKGLNKRLVINFV